MPHGPGPFPAVVLVPGSGYEDRDSSDGPNAAGRDVAWGLASSGVASLQYDERTLTHALAFARLPAYTLDDEMVDDPLAAVALLWRTPGIDPARIYVLGASRGGSAAPRIGARDPGIA
jgi:dipeptidyl aminopeptidase/acylaminoacyl peptidase